MEEKEEAVFVPIDWQAFAFQTPSRYATDLIVQTGKHEVILLFFESRPPITVGTAEQQKEQIKQVKVIQPECVGRIIVAKDRMPDFLAVLASLSSHFLPESPESEETKAQNAK